MLKHLPRVPKKPKEAQEFLNISLEIQSEYASDKELDAFVDAIQEAHEKQSDIEVLEGETREQFYTRVFSDARCKQEMAIAHPPD